MKPIVSTYRNAVATSVPFTGMQSSNWPASQAAQICGTNIQGSAMTH